MAVTGRRMVVPDTIEGVALAIGVLMIASGVDGDWERGFEVARISDPICVCICSVLVMEGARLTKLLVSVDGAAGPDPTPAMGSKVTSGCFWTVDLSLASSGTSCSLKWVGSGGKPWTLSKNSWPTI